MLRAKPKIEDIFPPIETALELEPEELAPFVLRFLKDREESNESINRHNFTLVNSPAFLDYANGHQKELGERLMEAWIWLEKEMFIVPKPGGGGTDEFFITRRGKKILDEQDFDSYKKGSLLPSENLDPVLVRKVKPLFIRGDYDTAIFQAFKEVEIRVRGKAGYTDNEIGVSLMRKAFKPSDGPLADSSLDQGEQQAVSDLFAGAMGSFKNPSSHRNVEYTDPSEVADIIHIANQLLRMCEER